MRDAAKQRSDQDWVADISVAGERRENALLELRTIIVAGLQRTFRGRLDKLAFNIEDTAQEALLRITSRLDTFRGDSRFTTWAMAVAVRAAVTEMRRARWRDVSLDEMAEAGRLPPAARDKPGADERLDSSRLMEVVRRTIETELTQRQRRALEAELGGAPPDEIARRLDTNRNALYKLVHDARVRLKQAILREGWTERDVRSLIGRR